MTSFLIKNFLYIGNYFEWYPRNYTFINGLKKNGINGYEINTFKSSSRTVKLFISFIKEIKKIKKQKYDLIIFHSVRPSILFPLVKIFAYIKKIPLINDFYISRYLSYRFDYNLKNINKRKIVPKFFYWFYYYILDFLECYFSDLIILDTNSHIKYFYETFNIPLKKFRKIYVGTPDDIFFPIEKVNNREKIIVGFWGIYIPLQGVKYIIKAAKLLEDDADIRFFLLGNGMTYKENRNLAKKLNLRNIEFINTVPIEELPKIISRCDIALGIFGDTPKTKLVIPNKVFNAIAMKIPVITSDTPAIRELFTKDENIVLCERANPKSLAEAILKLKNNNNFRLKIGENGYNLFIECLTTNKIGFQLKKILNNFISS